MRIYEYGLENPECILLIHPSLVTWDYFESVIPLLEKRYHLLIPALPGYDLKDHEVSAWTFVWNLKRMSRSIPIGNPRYRAGDSATYCPGRAGNRRLSF